MGIWSILAPYQNNPPGDVIVVPYVSEPAKALVQLSGKTEVSVTKSGRTSVGEYSG